MKINLMKIALGATFFSLVLVFQNCSNAKFTTEVDPNALNSVTGTDDPNGGDDPSCRPTTVSSSKIVKVLFVVDSSGSNVGEGGATPTDPQKKWRSSTVSNFISTFSSRSNFQFGMIS